MGKEIVATYEMIKGYKNYPSNFILTISEFIDNSIGSYQDNNVENDIDGLVINIEFNTEDVSNKKIFISDNANGMTAEKLEEAMQPNERRGKSDTNYNQYGVGMKLGIFWLGSDCTIWSKTNNQENKLSLFTTKNNSYDKVIVEAVPSFDNKIKTRSGTFIEISNVHDNCDITLKNNELKKLEDGLGWRYNKLIKKGLKINLIVKSNEEKKNKIITIEPYFNKPFNMNNLLLKNKHKNDKNNNQRIQTYNKMIDELHQEYTEAYENQELPLEVIQVFNKLADFEDVEVTKKIKISGHEVDLKFAIMDPNKSNMAKYSGVTIYHMDRAIMHGPNDTNKNSNFQFVERTGASGQDARYRWLYGELNLTGIEVPDENKSDFLWSTNGKEDLINELKTIYKNLEKILILLSRIDKIEPNKLPNEKEIKEISSGFISKFSNLEIKRPQIKIRKNDIDEKGYGLDFKKIKILDQEFEIFVYETNGINDFLKVDINPEEKIINIMIEAENKFWKPFVNKEGFKADFLYPLAFILGMVELFYNNDELLEKLDENKTKTFSGIISELIRRWV